MSGCSRWEEFLSNRLEGEAQSAFLAHLEGCAECRLRVEEWRGIERSLGAWAAERSLPPPTPAEAARLVIELGPKRSRHGWRMPLVYAGLAAVSAVAVVFVALHQTRPSQERAAVQSAPEVARAELPKPAVAPAPAAPVAAAPVASPVRFRLLRSQGGEVVRPGGDAAEQLSVPAEGSLLVALGGDRVSVDSGSRIEVVEALPGQTRLRLLSGRAVAEVSRREGGGYFAFEAAGFEIRVIGTRFGVERWPDSRVRVAVTRGAVAVIGPEGERHEVREGQSLTFGTGRPWRFAALRPTEREEIAAALSVAAVEKREKSDGSDQSDRSDQPDQIAAAPIEPPAAPEAEEQRLAPDLAVWRRQVLSGDRAGAERAMVAYLAEAPGDVAVWSLLAACRRRAEDWTGAVDAYREVIARGNVRTANQARYDAAAVLQDRLGRSGPAAALLEEYLREPLLLRAEAMVRLARAYGAEGQAEKARRLLEQVVSEHGSTSAAVEARRLLGTMRGAKR